VTYKYITDAEVSTYDDEVHLKEEGLLQSILNIISVKPLDFHMKNIWNVASTNQELVVKFKAMIGDYLINQDIEEVAAYLRELKCSHFYHEFVKRLVLMAMEKVWTWNYRFVGFRSHCQCTETAQRVITEV